VLRPVAEGLANRAIAARLAISPRTVNTHLEHIYAKLGVASRTAAVREAARLGTV
jgi:DNA-binding CsgD family transcriptional regulator